MPLPSALCPSKTTIFLNVSYSTSWKINNTFVINSLSSSSFNFSSFSFLYLFTKFSFISSIFPYFSNLSLILKALSRCFSTKLVTSSF